MSVLGIGNNLTRGPSLTGDRWSGGSLASLIDDPLSKRFCAWRGASDRRYIASVFPTEPAALDAGLPAFDACLLMAVVQCDGGRRILFSHPIERLGDRSAAIARGLAEGADEWHVHFLAESPRARLAASEDIAKRHVVNRAEREQADAA